MVLLDIFTKAGRINGKEMPEFEVIIAIRLVHVKISWVYYRMINVFMLEQGVYCQL